MYIRIPTGDFLTAESCRDASLRQPDHGVFFTAPKAGAVETPKLNSMEPQEDTVWGAGDAHDALVGQTDVFAEYYAAQGQGSDEATLVSRPPQFVPHFGLAVEKPPEGLSLETLWSAI